MDVCLLIGVSGCVCVSQCVYVCFVDRCKCMCVCVCHSVCLLIGVSECVCVRFVDRCKWMCVYHSVYSVVLSTGLDRLVLLAWVNFGPQDESLRLARTIPIAGTIHLPLYRYTHISCLHLSTSLDIYCTLTFMYTIHLPLYSDIYLHIHAYTHTHIYLHIHIHIYTYTLLIPACTHQLTEPNTPTLTSTYTHRHYTHIQTHQYHHTVTTTHTYTHTHRNPQELHVRFLHLFISGV